ncbi:uncharacterized protein F4822DRAFT_406798 [Hypoxylon trugodes]|uniref:uncharacterized protein n=1 Tax=Hypoxylon trugodes TaxID=326681 RepID=UPI002199FB55|nr:uncharacterized protein F4822DRAFT_406798 [Hypoxylon trugodes]KAI1387517.1 hypothetical protein F4822DRAFT_406798 [Hypoxylon trugodes]
MAGNRRLPRYWKPAHILAFCFLLYTVANFICTKHYELLLDAKMWWLVWCLYWASTATASFVLMVLFQNFVDWLVPVSYGGVELERLHALNEGKEEWEWGAEAESFAAALVALSG